MAGRECIVNYNRPRRGPKKGQIESLYSRLEVLEEQVVDQLEDAYIGGVGAPENFQALDDSHQSILLDKKELGKSTLYALAPSLLSGSESYERSFLPSPIFAPSSSSFTQSSTSDREIIYSDLYDLVLSLS
ncbi:hypothetical protein BDV19DRAFT_394165 [Aspergillus venezuelensis]